MRLSGLINPLHNLEQTARDLAYYLRNINRDEFLRLMTDVRKSYGGPADSWFWFMFYSRSRRGQLDQIINELQKGQDVNAGHQVEDTADQEKSDVDKLSKSDIVVTSKHVEEVESIDSLSKSLDILLSASEKDNQSDKPKTITEIVSAILHDQDGGWEETSANTTLLRAMVKNLHNYDPKVELTLTEVRELKGLVFDAIEQRLQAEAKLLAEETRLREITDQTLQMRKALLANQELLLRKKEEIVANESRILELQSVKSLTGKELQEIEEERRQKTVELSVCLSQLKDLESDRRQREEDYERQFMSLAAEKHKREEELEAARQRLLLLNPQFDIKKFTSGQLAQVMDEARLVGEVSMKTYIAEYSANEKKSSELKEMTGTVARAKAGLGGKNLPGMGNVIEPQADTTTDDPRAQQERDERLKEASKICGARIKTNDGDTRSFLEGFFQVKMDERRQEEEKRKREKLESEALGQLYAKGVRTSINDAEALSHVNIDADAEHLGEKNEEVAAKKPRRAFREMKVRGPQSENPQFMALFGEISKTFKARVAEPGQPQSGKTDTVLSPVKENSAETDQASVQKPAPKIDNERRLRLQMLLSPGFVQSETETSHHDARPSEIEDQAVIKSESNTLRSECATTTSVVLNPATLFATVNPESDYSAGIVTDETQTLDSGSENLRLSH